MLGIIILFSVPAIIAVVTYYATHKPNPEYLSPANVRKANDPDYVNIGTPEEPNWVKRSRLGTKLVDHNHKGDDILVGVRSNSAYSRNEDGSLKRLDGKVKGKAAKKRDKWFKNEQRLGIKAGRLAKQQGKDMSDNPYGFDDVKRTFWQQGFAMEIRDAKKPA